MDDEILMQLLTDPAMAEQLAAMSAYGDKSALLGQAAKRADAMRGTPSAEGRQVDRAYVAASPLEHLGVAVNRGLGERNLRNATSDQQSLISGDMDARKALAKAMATAMQRAKAQQAPGPGPAPGPTVGAPSTVPEGGMLDPYAF